MSQKKSKLINKFLKIGDLDTKCKKWKTEVSEKLIKVKGQQMVKPTHEIEHEITASKEIKRNYASLNHLDKFKMSQEMKGIIQYAKRKITS